MLKSYARAVKALYLLPADISNEIQMVIKWSDYSDMRQHLLREDGKERISFVLFGARGKGRTTEIHEIYVHKVINLQDADYVKQSDVYVLPKLESQLKVFNEYANKGTLGFMHVHSHPFAGNADFSSVDDSIVSGSIRSLKDYLLSGDHDFPFLFGRMVIGRDDSGFTGYIYDRAYRLKGELSGLRIINNKVSIIRRAGSRLGSDNASRQDRDVLDRNIKWLGDQGQMLLSNAHLVICGLGGAGSLVAQNARGLGLKKITLIDGDRIEKSNLNRLPAATLNDVGAFKVEVAKRMIQDVSPATEVSTITEMAHSSNEAVRAAISDADIVIAGVDSFSARFEVQYLAARYLKPLIDIGSGITLKAGEVKFMGGQVVCYVPDGPCLCCQTVIKREIDSDLSLEVKRATGYVRNTDLTPTSVVTINAIMAGHAVDAMIKYITGFSEINTYIKCDLLNNSYDTFNFSKNPNCYVCGERGIEGKADEIDFINGLSMGAANATG